jgi:uncharacterized protein (TIGR02231 family)
MKKFMLFLITLLVFSQAQSQKSETLFTSKIETVTVFPRTAQVSRTANGNIPTGNNNLVFTGISPSINVQSIQFKATGDFIILSVNHRLNYITPKDLPEQVQKLKDKQSLFQDDLNIKNANLQVLAEEEKMILANRVIGGQQNGVTVENLSATARFYREHLLEIKKEQLKIRKEVATVTKEIQKLQQQINEINAVNSTKATSEIVVAVQADKTVKGNFSIQYLVQNAGWKPAYDLRIKDVISPVGMTYKASVNQNSGEDWSNVALSLATGNPTLGGTKPSMNTWWLREYVIGYAKGRKKEANAAPRAYVAEDVSAEFDEEVADYAAVEQVERTTFTEFAIKLPQTIASDGKPYVVNIADYELPADYVYYAAPKLDKNAFLTAQVTGWESYNLLNGQASLFFEGTYLGKSFINVETANDTLDLSLGRDAGIVIKRTKNKQFKDKKFIGKKVTKTIGWDIELRNKKNQEVTIIIEDQIPVSTTDEIEVSLESSKGATLDTSTGKLKWELTLKPGKRTAIDFKYAVKYPKRMNMQLE